MSQPDEGNAALGVPHVLTSTDLGASDALSELGMSARCREPLSASAPAGLWDCTHIPEPDIDSILRKLRRPDTAAGLRERLAEA